MSLSPLICMNREAENWISHTKHKAYISCWIILGGGIYEQDGTMFEFWRKDDFNFLYVNSGKLSLYSGSLNPASNSLLLWVDRLSINLENHPGFLPASPTHLFVLYDLIKFPFFLWIPWMSNASGKSSLSTLNFICSIKALS